MTVSQARNLTSKTCTLALLCLLITLLAVPGNALAAPADLYSVGGTVSGLSGTVVLADNGSDQLSVSADGSFTFGSQLAAGAAYEVSVVSYPSGQVCSVSGGSGTVGSADVTSVAVSCSDNSAASASDGFGRADGGLGPAWTAMSDGGLVISSGAVAGTNAGGNSGDIRTGEAYSGDQYSQITLTGTQLTGTQWIGPAVRAQAGGAKAYVGIYFWDNGNPELMLFLRSGENSWTSLGTPYASGPLPAGSQLKLVATRNSLSLLLNGSQVLWASDSTLTGGAPGIIANGTATAASWAGGDMPSGSYPVGGTVSGLSGTVVLADNGSDQLSVSADGSFTFASQLADGSAYDVSVASEPAGQACSVSHTSGTVTGAAITNLAVSCTNATGPSASDSFNRADGGVGPPWAAMSDGGLVTSSGAVTGTNAGGTSGDIRTGEAYTSDQYSQITLTGTQLTGTQWIGAAVRAQVGGTEAYVGAYEWNSGSPLLVLSLRSGENGWTRLASQSTAALPAGTQLEVEAVGNTVVLLENGSQVIGASDGTLTGGAPGIIANGTATAASWAGGTAGFQVNYQSTASSGIKTFNVISASNGYGPQVLRVLPPSNPAAGVAHNVLILLPVQAGLGNTFGDGISTLASLNAQNQYNLTIVEPSFALDPWDANDPNDPNLQYETFLTQELVPWIQQNLDTTGTERIWLMGFSKSGFGAQDLMLKYPGLFALAASWDFPANASTYSQYGDSAAIYGTNANFVASYMLSPAFVSAHSGPFQHSNRIWIGGYSLYQGDVADYNALLTSEGIAHSTEVPQQMSHNWSSGWVPLALAALYKDSLNSPATP